MKPRVTLFTIQKPGHDLTERCKPLPDYGDPSGPYYPLAQYLGWKQWAWCFANLKDFFENNGWLDFDSLLHHALWRLRVPYESIVWCSLDGQCEDVHNIKEHIHPDPLTIRLYGEIPMGLVRTPIKREWVFSKETARDAFKMADLLE